MIENTDPARDVDEKKVAQRHQAFKFELRPTAAQTGILKQHCGLSRFVYNWTLDQIDVWWQANKDRDRKDRDERPTKASVSRQWTAAVDEIAPWARMLCRSTVTYAIRAAFDAWQNFYRQAARGEHKKRLAEMRRKGRKIKRLPCTPRYKSRRGRWAFTLQDQSFSRGRYWLRLAKIGRVRTKEPTVRLDGRCLRLVVSRDAGDRWFCSVMVEREVEQPSQPRGAPAGLDLGMADVLTVASGDDLRQIPHPRKLEKMLTRMKRIQRSARRRTINSCGWRKSVLAVQRLHFRIKCARADWIHKWTKILSTEHRVVVAAEGFNARELAGDKVWNQKLARRTRRGMADAAWGEIRRQLGYKCSWYGSHCEILDRVEATDATCHVCGAQNPRPDPWASKYSCSVCALETTRATNTARLLELYGLGEGPLSPDGGTGGQPGTDAGGDPTEDESSDETSPGSLKPESLSRLNRSGESSDSPGFLSQGGGREGVASETSKSKRKKKAAVATEFQT